MKVFKFGGASVKDISAVKNLAQIVKGYTELVIVVSAMGKTTNALEKLLHHYFTQDSQLDEGYRQVLDFSLGIIKGLFPGHQIFAKVDEICRILATKLQAEPTMTYDFEYDQIVSYGEILSTIIVAEFLKYTGIDCTWVDIRKILKTDSTYRDARVNFKVSENLVKEALSEKKIYLTQGFIASDENNLSTTLGREGSDYTAALLAYFLDAEKVIVWKDVPGVLNADPKWFDNTIKLEKLTYTDAIELAFYGASVIHPKTIQPLKKKSIPLEVKSFFNPQLEGTKVGDFNYEKLVPSFIFKMDQVLIDVYPLDLSFIAEDTLQYIFQVLSEEKIKVNLMQNTAVRFRICTNNEELKVTSVVNKLSCLFRVTVLFHLELITIRYFDNATIARVMDNKEMILEQRSQTTIQILVRDKSIDSVQKIFEPVKNTK